MNELQDKFRGAILGLAIGDALGCPAEFRSRQTILERFGPEGLTDFVSIADERWSGSRPFVAGKSHPAGTYTDDTQMSIAVAEGLLDAGIDASLDRQMDLVAGHFVTWSRSPDNNRAPGSTCMTGCANLARGVPWRTAGVANSKGCGSAMRVTAVGLAFAGDRERLLDTARASSLLTHGHDAALEGAAAAALCVALGLGNSTPQEMLAEVLEACGGRSDDFDGCMKRLIEHADSPPALALSSAAIGEAWVAEEAIASALYCVARSPDDFRATVLCGTNTDGDSDSIAAIAGSISGALNGASAIPEHWVAGVERSAYLVDLADRLFEMTCSR